MEITTASAQATQTLGQDIGTRLVKQKNKHNTAIVLALRGELGSGKTTFVQGLARGLGIAGRILSPTFIFVREYKLTNSKNFTAFYHFDLYRMVDTKEIADLNLSELFAEPQKIICIEWPEKVGKILPENTVYFNFHSTGSFEHIITIEDKQKIITLNSYD